jgi:DNA repair protein RadD
MAFTLRPYQQKAVDSLFDYLANHPDGGNPLVVAPTASGKSLIQAAFVQRAIAEYPNTRILLLSHVKELLEQNYEKIKALCPTLPIGLYSAGLKKRQTLFPITIAGIQSIYKKADLFGWVDILIVDEAHTISPVGQTMYQQLITDLKRYNPRLRVIGLTATPFRLKHGHLTQQEDPIFTDIAYEITINYLLGDNPEGVQYLSTLKSKPSETQVDLTGVKITAGDFNKKQVEERFTSEITITALSEVIQLATTESRKSWLIFASGVKHAEFISDHLNALGVRCAVVSEATPATDRDRILQDFKAGKITAVANVNTLTTGFDAPCIDLLVLLRATQSVGLYIQLLGRAMRLHPGKSSATVLDYGGNLARFGPINHINVNQSDNTKPKQCLACSAWCHGHSRRCNECGEPFPVNQNDKICPGCGHEATKGLRVCDAWEFECRQCTFMERSFAFYVKKINGQYVASKQVDCEPRQTTCCNIDDVQCPECKKSGQYIAFREPHTNCNTVLVEDRKPKINAEAASGDFVAQSLSIPQELNVWDVHYREHHKPDKPTSLRVTYETDKGAINEWVCLEHPEPALRRAQSWWRCNSKLIGLQIPATVREALKRISELKRPTKVLARKPKEYWEITAVIEYEEVT